MMQSSVSETTVLHIFGGNSHNEAWNTLLTVLQPGHGLLLWHDAVSIALAEHTGGIVLAELSPTIERFALGPDLDARGLSSRPLQAGIKRIDDAEFVELACRYRLSHTWF